MSSETNDVPAEEPAQPQPQPAESEGQHDDRPWYRRTVVLTGAATVIVAVTAGAVGYALGDSSTPAAAPHSWAQAVPGRHHAHRERGNAMIGVIAAEKGNIWTIERPDGDPAAVTITPDTHFGSRDGAETAAQFPVGTPVVVRGPVDHHTMTALMILEPLHSHQRQ